MYLKLAFRNAKRSLFDYILYISTMTILVSIMCISNSIAVFGDMRAGLQTASLPLLIVLIMFILVNYINTFMVKQRAKELATYMLLGMEKGKLTLLFLLEFCMIGAICFLLGVLAGAGIFKLIFHSAFQESPLSAAIMAKSIFHTFIYFCIIEILTGFSIKHKLFELQINQFMNEKRRNQSIDTGKEKFWRRLTFASLLCFLLLIFGIVFLSEMIMSMSISVISIPMLLGIFAFYKWIYAFFSEKRISGCIALYQGNRLYRIAEITASTKTGVKINTVFCICLLFSAVSFVFGVLLLKGYVTLFSTTNQQWMGFLQISICIIFMVIYFSILSLLQIVDLKRQSNHMQIMLYLGKDQIGLKTLIRSQLLIKLSLPMIMCFVLLGIGVPFINYKINTMLPNMHNALLNAAGGFMACFIFLYLCYFFIVCGISEQYINEKVTLHKST